MAFAPLHLNDLHETVRETTLSTWGLNQSSTWGSRHIKMQEPKASDDTLNVNIYKMLQDYLVQ